MTGSEMIGMVMIASFVWLIAKWRGWAKRRLGVSRNRHTSGRVRTGPRYEEMTPFPECFDDNDTAYAEMEDDL